MTSDSRWPRKAQSKSGEGRVLPGNTRFSAQDEVASEERSPHGLALWGWWVLATTVGWALCGALIGAAIEGPDQVWQYAFVPLTSVGQWLLLRRRFARAERWIVVTIGGSIVAGVAYAAILALPESLMGPAGSGVRQGLSTIFDGLSLGAVQWLVLRGTVRDSWRWVPATAGPLWLLALMDLTRGTAGQEGFDGLSIGLRIQLNAISLGMVGLIIGLVSGAVLTRLVQLPREMSKAGGDHG